MSFPGFDLRRWSAVLAGRISTDKQSEESARQAADALAEVLEPDDLQRLTQRLIEIQKNANKKEKKNG